MWSVTELPLTPVPLLGHWVPPPTCRVHAHSLSAPSSQPHHLVLPASATHFFISINFPFLFLPTIISSTISSLHTYFAQSSPQLSLKHPASISSFSSLRTCHSSPILS